MANTTDCMVLLSVEAVLHEAGTFPRDVGRAGYIVPDCSGVIYSCSILSSRGFRQNSINTVNGWLLGGSLCFRLVSDGS